VLFKNSVRTSKRTPHFTITKINWLRLFKEVIAVYSENDTKPINTKRSITDSQSRWFTWLPLGLKELTVSSAPIYKSMSTVTPPQKDFLQCKERKKEKKKEREKESKEERKKERKKD
jgi:hypothetical protein